MLMEYFGNTPMRNDGTCSRHNVFSSPRHRRPFKLKSNCNQTKRAVCVCDGEKITHCRNCYVITLPAYPMVIAFSSIENTSCANFLSARWRNQSPIIIIIQASASRFLCCMWSAGTDHAYYSGSQSVIICLTLQ